MALICRLILRSFVSRLVFFFWGENCSFPTPIMWRAHTFKNTIFETKFGKRMTWHVPAHLEELDYKVGTSFTRYKRCFQLPSKIVFLKGLNLSVLDRSWKWTVLTRKRGTNLETKLLEVKHISSPKVIYLGLPNSVLKLTFSNVCGLPFRITKVLHLAPCKKPPSWIGVENRHNITQRATLIPWALTM